MVLKQQTSKLFESPLDKGRARRSREYYGDPNEGIRNVYFAWNAGFHIVVSYSSFGIILCLTYRTSVRGKSLFS